MPSVDVFSPPGAEPFAAADAKATDPQLSQLLTAHFSSEELSGDNAYKCEGCATAVEATKTMAVNRAPSVLVRARARARSACPPVSMLTSCASDAAGCRVEALRLARRLPWQE